MSQAPSLITRVARTRGFSSSPIRRWIAPHSLHILYNGLKTATWRGILRKREEDIPEGIYYKEKRVCVRVENAGTGLRMGSTCFRAVTLERAIAQAQHSPDVAKMDCEGCEYSILTTPCGMLRRVSNWLIEIHHGAETLVVDRMAECGFAHRVMKRFNSLVSLILFHLA